MNTTTTNDSKTETATTVALFGRYRLLATIGRGVTGEVWRAEMLGPERVARRVALKILHPELARDDARLRRFADEARIQARLAHPNVVQMIEFGIEPGAHLAMELVEGADVAKLLVCCARAGRALPPAAALFIAAEAARGLAHAHTRRDDRGQPLGIVHRDVCPSNLLLSLDGEVKVSDFGLAKARDNGAVTRNGETLGRITYMAPERLVRDSFDHRADVFSLGVVLWELLTAQPIVPVTSAAAIVHALTTGDLRRPSQVNPRLSPAIDALVMSALNPAPELRTASAAEFEAQLRAALRKIAPDFDPSTFVRVLAAFMPETRWNVTEPERAPVARAQPPQPPPLPPRPINEQTVFSWRIADKSFVDRKLPPQPSPPPPPPPPTLTDRLRARLGRAPAWTAVLLGLGLAAAPIAIGLVAHQPEPAAVLPQPLPPPLPPPAPLPRPSPAPVARRCSDCAALAARALDAVTPAVRRCLSAGGGVSAHVEFDDARGVATRVTLTPERAAMPSARALSCVQTALTSARFTPQPDAVGVTPAQQAWRVSRPPHRPSALFLGY